MFGEKHMSFAEQLHELLTGETVWMDTDFMNCDVRLIDDTVLICTPDGHSFKISATPVD